MHKGYAIELANVVKRFGEVAAVDHVTLQIHDGEFFSLLGPSGCGKTTTLRMIAGFEYPSGGELMIHGRPMATVPPHHRPVNTVFQSYALFPHMTVAQNVAFGLKMKRVPRAELGARVQAALDMVRLAGFAERYPRQMSGGQQQRVALARALVNQPEVLLLDEPLGALDQKLRKEMQLELKSLQHRVGITFIFVTHDQEEALTMSDRIAVMNQGKVLQVGTPTEIYERPTCKFVADFIGETNFIEGKVVEQSDEYATIQTPDGLQLRGYTPRPVNLGEAATLSLRPEKARLVLPSHARPDDAFTMPVHVEMITYIGSDTRITVRLNEGRTLDVWEQNTLSTLDRNAYWQPGEAAVLVCPPANALVLTE
ncbi:ABC transporter ATP-binding protein [Candidatus Chloroploca sp. M-50]|uniref:Spermidine/putrescine import ATP-binding protein PotA n=1 Tax=Candidatus Chloroploca mongolica TaxID=2528176 RepID=A0ABS4DAF7_9CHLR|nr:ABC transporter ATP-binding protein [Candidatus Chloroploca mongolica]MBP1466427.1 ABC transporter ATP-binding protein [Candidatus Chloroploca mongolica]